MKQSIRALRTLLCAVLLVLCFVVESSIGIHISVFGAHLDFLPPIVAASALCLGCPAGLVCGLLAGVLYDASGAVIEGLYPIYFLIWGVFCGLLGESPKTQEHRLRATILLSLGMIIVLTILRYLFYFQFVSETGLAFVLRGLVVQAILMAALCLPVYWVVTHLSGAAVPRRAKRRYRGEQVDEYDE